MNDNIKITRITNNPESTAEGYYAYRKTVHFKNGCSRYSGSSTSLECSIKGAEFALKSDDRIEYFHIEEVFVKYGIFS